jgi:hypothetical protein
LRPDLFQKLDGVIGDLAVEGLGVGLSGGDIQRPLEGEVAVLLRPLDGLLFPDRPYAPQRREAFHLRLVGEEHGGLRPNAPNSFSELGQTLLVIGAFAELRRGRVQLYSRRFSASRTVSG